VVGGAVLAKWPKADKLHPHINMGPKWARLATKKRPKNENPIDLKFCIPGNSLLSKSARCEDLAGAASVHYPPHALLQRYSATLAIVT